MSKISHTPPDDNKALAKKRGESSHQRKLLKKFRKQAGNARAELAEEEGVGFSKSELLDGLHAHRKKHYKKSDDKHRQSIVSLKNFDFISEPQATLRMLKQIIEADCSSEAVHIDFKDYFCWDIAPYMIISQLLDETTALNISGTYSPALKKVLEATELAENFEPIEDQDPDIKDVWPLPVTSCTGGGSKVEAPHVKLAEDTAKKINLWLREVGFELTEDGDDKLVVMMCELLDNAIIHSKPETWDGKAWIGGFMVKRKCRDGSFDYVCHLSVISIGASIYQSMQNCSEETREEIKGLVDSHKRGLTLKKRWNKETLWTLYALQDGVSRVKEQKGGKGLMEIIEFFGQLGGGHSTSLPTAMVIISGSTCIRIFGQKPERNANNLRRMAFNEVNDLHKPPSKDYIWSMKKDNFPGTILSMRFLLNPEYLKKLT